MFVSGHKNLLVVPKHISNSVFRQIYFQLNDPLHTHTWELVNRRWIAGLYSLRLHNKWTEPAAEVKDFFKNLARGWNRGDGRLCQFCWKFVHTNVRHWDDKLDALKHQVAEQSNEDAIKFDLMVERVARMTKDQRDETSREAVEALVGSPSKADLEAIVGQVELHIKGWTSGAQIQELAEPEPCCPSCMVSRFNTHPNQMQELISDVIHQYHKKFLPKEWFAHPDSPPCSDTESDYD